jgi:hypothetical protein
VSGCFPEPTTPDLALGRDGEGMPSFLARSTMPHAIELRRFVNANLRLLPPDVSTSLCKALHGEYFRPSLFELVVARTFQILGTRELTYETEIQTGSQPDLQATFNDAAVIMDATVPEFDAEIIRNWKSQQPLIKVIEDEIPAGWSFFVESLPDLGPDDSRKDFKKAIRAEFAKLANLEVPPEALSPLAPDSRAVFVELDRGSISLRLGGRPSSWQRAYAGGPASGAFGDTNSHVERALRRKRHQLRGAGAPALVAIAGGMGERIDDFDIALFGTTFERHDEHRRVVEVGFNPTGIWGRLRDGESVVAGMLVFCRWQWTLGDDPVLYMNPRFSGSLPRALEVLHRRGIRDGTIASTPARSSGFFPLLRGAAGLAP